MPKVGPYIYDVSISGFTRSSIVYIYEISSLRVKQGPSGFPRDSKICYTAPILYAPGTNEATVIFIMYLNVVPLENIKILVQSCGVTLPRFVLLVINGLF